MLSTYGFWSGGSLCATPAAAVYTVSSEGVAPRPTVVFKPAKQGSSDLCAAAQITAPREQFCKIAF
jgi:hypothetical protein